MKVWETAVTQFLFFGGTMESQPDSLELLGHPDTMKRALDLEPKVQSSGSSSAADLLCDTGKFLPFSDLYNMME